MTHADDRIRKARNLVANLRKQRDENERFIAALLSGDKVATPTQVQAAGSRRATLARRLTAAEARLAKALKAGAKA